VNDLGIASAGLFERVESFKVEEAPVGISDHHRLVITLYLDTQINRRQGGQRAVRLCPWNQNKWSTYADMLGLASARIHGLVERLRDADLNGLEVVSRDLGSLLQGVAREAFPPPKRRERTHGALDISWWDSECELLKERVVRAHKSYKAGVTGLDEVRHLTQGYKVLIKAKKRGARLIAQENMAKEASRDPVEFWRRMKTKHDVCRLEDIQKAEIYWGQLLNPNQEGLGAAAHRAPVGAPSGGEVIGRTQGRVLEPEAESKLNGPITSLEVARAVESLSNGKSSPDGVRGECFKYARARAEDGERRMLLPVVVTLLVALFNKCFVDGLGIPPSWRKSWLIPIYKGVGSVLAPDNYRGISGLASIYKIYAIILLARITAACTRAPTQCGFRKNTGTIPALFMFRHALHASCDPRRPRDRGGLLYTGFIDFRKAFDCVIRPLLWVRLREQGITGNMLKALQDIYAETKF